MKCSDSYITMFSKIKSNWDKIAKPLDSLGKLEDIIAKIGAVQQLEHPVLSKAAAVILCGDNGIVEEGISQSDQSVTRICAENIAAGKTTVGIMAKQNGAEVFVYDIGINTEERLPLVIDRKIRKGTRNFLKESAMTPDEVNAAINTGIQIVKDLKDKEYDILCIGEMGIGNTTTSSAIASALLKMNAEDVTGRGAGLNDSGLKKKIEVVKTAVEKYDLMNKDALTVLQTAGGFDIAAMTGVYIGAKKYGMPVVLDGAISMVAALVAERIEEGVLSNLIPSHKSREPLVKGLCSELNIDPVIDASMALGEGTGAVLMLGVIKTALAVYENSVPFSESNVEQYTRFK